MTTRTRARIFFGSVVVMVIAVCILAIRLADHSLTAAGARRLACPDGDYAWVTNADIVTFITKSASVPTRYDPSTQETVFNVTAEETNVASGSRASLSEFKAQLPDEHSSDTEHWFVSPDGTRLLYGPKEGGDYYNEGTAPLSIWTFASDTAEEIDDEVYVGIDYSVQSALWMPDSSLLLIAKGDGNSMAALYNTSSKDDSSVAIPLTTPTPDALGISPENHLIYTDLYRVVSGIIIYDQEIFPLQPPPREFKPILPPGASVNELSLSPKGTSLAWVTSSIHTPPGYQLIKKIAPWLARRITPYPVVSIYISWLDGTGMRLVGMENNPPNQPDEVVRNVRWRPDGKSLSFRWRRGVYLAPAE